MRIETTTRKLYKYEELTDDAKEKAIDGLYDINVVHDWWEYVCEDAKTVGLKITELDIDRGSYCKGDFIESANECAGKIVKQHGKTCETYKTAKAFLKDYKKAYKEGEDRYQTVDSENQCSDLKEEFLKSILEDYRIILTKEYEYLTSEASVIETIEANDYEFTEDGKLA